MSSCLEFLSKDEVEVTSCIGLAAEDTVEAVSPVNAEQTYHWQEYTGTDSDRPLHVQRVELLDVAPGIAAFRKG